MNKLKKNDPKKTFSICSKQKKTQQQTEEKQSNKKSDLSCKYLNTNT